MMNLSKISPPIAKKIPTELQSHNDLRIDYYHWLNDRDNPEVIEHIKAENDYCDAIMADTKAFQNDLFHEMKSRIKEDDESVPYKYNGYWYITRYEKNKNYPIYTRKKATLEAKEELLFDCNVMAEGDSYFKLVGISISPDNTKVAFGLDTTGRRNYTIYVKDIETNTITKDQIENTTGSSSWGNDNQTLFYTKKDDTTLRAFQIYKYKLGSNHSNLVYEEKDNTFGVAVYKSKSRKYIIIASYSTLTNEYRFLNANTPDDDFKIFSQRIRGLEYSISHYKDHFYILTNKDNAVNFKLMRTSESATEVSNWQELIAHRPDTLIEGVDIFKDYLVVSERTNGLNQLKVITWNGNQDYYIPFNSETYTCYSSVNVDFDTEILRYTYNSLTTPASVIDFNMRTKTHKVLKEQEVLDNSFKKTNYIEKRIWAKAEDGTDIPMSMVYKKGIEQNGKNPLLLYAYGSYGSTVDPFFSSIRLSLLNRGFIYVIAHVRGGEYLGREWYENGKLLHKKNTFSDFIDCSKHLISDKYTSAEHLYAMGGSAGGLLMGVILNEAPELYNGVIASVPFVDVITTMLDESIPLTTGEFDEWGNPKEENYYKYIKSYSPYDNVKAQHYPNMFISSGLNDSQVQYWEPTKWVAKLRDLKTDTNQLLLRTNIEAGHSGASGRFESLKEDVEEFAFLCNLEGIKN